MKTIFRPKRRFSRNGDWSYFGPRADGKGFEYSTYEEAQHFLEEQNDPSGTEYGVDKLMVR